MAQQFSLLLKFKKDDAGQPLSAVLGHSTSVDLRDDGDEDIDDGGENDANIKIYVLSSPKPRDPNPGMKSKRKDILLAFDLVAGPIWWLYSLSIGVQQIIPKCIGLTQH